MRYIAQRCGAWQVGDDPGGGAVEFRIFFPAGVDPQITSIGVAGSFQSQSGTTEWDFSSALTLTADLTDPAGVYWSAVTPVQLTAGFYEYKYLVEFQNGERRIVTDPCARYGGLSDQNSGIAVGGSAPGDNVVRPLPGGRRPLAELNVYELMIDDFTAEYRGARAPLDAVTDKLDDLRAMGINAILFMPWAAWKNPEFDWGYEPFQYYALEARYADDLLGPQEKLSRLKQLVSACHDRDLHVIMDGVFNHVSLQFPYQQLYQDPSQCPFTAGPFGGSFAGLQDLDFHNDCTNELILDVCQYWVETFGLDGLRLDNTVNYYVAGDEHGLPRLLSSLTGWLADRGEVNFSFTLEHIDLSAATVTNSTAATSFWDNSLFGLAFDWLWGGGFDGRLLNSLNNRRFLTDGKVPTLYLSNHDHSQVGWRAGARGDVGATGAWWRIQPYLIALFTSTAVPLVPNGQEFGEEHFLPEDDHNTGRRVTGRPLRWKLRSDPIGITLTRLHGTLARIRRDHPGLRSAGMYPDSWPEANTGPAADGIGIDVGLRTCVYQRWGDGAGGGTEHFVIVLNFSDEGRLIPAPFPQDGEWVDLLAGFSDATTWSVQVNGNSAQVPVGSNWGRVLYRPI
jgi:pullulanase